MQACFDLYKAGCIHERYSITTRRVW
jgi:hypothetical protein